MNYADITFHDIAKVEAQTYQNSQGTNFWTVLTLYNSPGSVVGEVTFFSNGSWPVIVGGLEPK